jgi:multicomponent Na+:H+ antiporter subunit A
VLFALLGLHAALAALAPLLARLLGRGALWACGLAPAATAVWAGTRAEQVVAGEPVVERLAWADQLGLSATLRLDAFALVMVALVAGIGVLVFAYAVFYFAPERPGGHERPDIGRFTGALTGFAGAMLGLVIADNLLLLYVFWELTTVASFLLIGVEDHRGEARAAAQQALLITVTGGLVMLAGFVVLGQAAGDYSLSGLVADPPTGAAATVGVFLSLVGAFAKSAQVPLHAWLPAAMAAPTPVSAYLHSATMVKAGVYLVARLAPAFAVIAGWQGVLVGFGVATMLVGGWRALRQFDLKLLLAHGTVSQLGFMMVLFGLGTPAATRAGVVLLLAHGAFKATLFFLTGVIDHTAHTRDLRKLSGLATRMPVVAVIAGLAAASMAGLPPLLGFLSKEAAYTAFVEAPGVLGVVGLVGIVAGSVLTFAYSGRFLWGAFAAKPGAAEPADTAHMTTPSPGFVAPAVVLTALTVAFGILPAPLSPLTSAATGALDAGAEAETLKLWHGLTPALGLSVVTIALGALAVAARSPIERAQAWIAGFPSTSEAYQAALVGFNRLADRVTAVAQTGSLPVYLAVILSTAVLAPGVALVVGGGLPGMGELMREGVFAESLVQIAIALAIAAAALGVVMVQRRFAAVLTLGAVGYGVALLFVVQGAPDLALTQLLIETLSLVVFVLVLRHLPDRFVHRRWRLGQGVRQAVAVAVGAAVAVFALVAGSVRSAAPVSETYLAQSVPEAGGHNIVNVILVDFRGLDTFGEITVLVTAAIGVAALIRARVTERVPIDRPSGSPGQPDEQAPAGPETPSPAGGRARQDEGADAEAGARREEVLE